MRYIFNSIIISIFFVATGAIAITTDSGYAVFDGSKQKNEKSNMEDLIDKLTTITSLDRSDLTREKIATIIGRPFTKLPYRPEAVTKDRWEIAQTQEHPYYIFYGLGNNLKIFGFNWDDGRGDYYTSNNPLKNMCINKDELASLFEHSGWINKFSSTEAGIQPTDVFTNSQSGDLRLAYDRKTECMKSILLSY